jgi:hypothetical protein
MSKQKSNTKGWLRSAPIEGASRNAYRINKNLPESKSKVRGPLSSLPMANAIGVKMQVVYDIDIDIDHPHWMQIDDRIFYFKIDSTFFYIEEPSKNPSSVYIGEGVIPNTHPKHMIENPKHINSPWGYDIWMTHWSADIESGREIKDREGWSWITYRRDLHKDCVARYIDPLLKYKKRFVYDMVVESKNIAPTNEFDHLVPQMFRPIPWVKQVAQRDMPGAMISGLYADKAHVDYLIDIVTETDAEVFCVTEKIFKPIICRQPFVVVSCRHYLRRLRQMGFKTFNPLIDESYDKEKDLDTRVQMALQAVQNFLETAHNHTDELQSIVNHNRAKYAYIRKHHTYDDRAAKKIRRYIKF